MKSVHLRSCTLLVLLLPAGLGPARGQGTLDDYRNASTVLRRLDGLTTGVVEGDFHWMEGGNRFWYRVTVLGGHRFVVVDAESWAKHPAFAHDRLAEALSSATGEQYSEMTLPFENLEIVESRQSLEVDAGTSRWRCSLADYSCTRVGPAQGPPPRRGRRGRPPARGGASGQAATAVASPDGRLEACIQGYNVAVRAVAKEPNDASDAGPNRGGFGGAAARRPICSEDPAAALLSRDGSEGDAYQFFSLEWSPDSKKLVAYRRRPGFDRLVHFVRSSPRDRLQPEHETTATLSGNPNAVYRKPGDRLDFHQPVLFHVESGRQIFIDDTLFPNAYQISRPVWRQDSRAYTFEYNQRGHQLYRVLEVDGETGRVRALISEEPATFFSYRPANSGLRDTGKNWRFDVDDGREILWMSERDGWNHLYLYDGVTGRVKNQITRGEWVVNSVDRVDVEACQIYFRALGMHRDQDPYFVHFYRINFDGSGLVAYTQADGTHDLSWSPDGRFYVDRYSRVDLPPVVKLHEKESGRVLPLEQGDMSAALATGWRPPEVFTAKGRDGVTDIWGIIVRPLRFDPQREYPVIEQIYAGPQGSFVPKVWGGGLRLLPTAELGFILVQIDGMGTNNRSKAFHDVAWKNLGDAGFPDRILWHRAVAARYPWYDISRVGVYGTSAGGQNATGAVLFHGDFYDAAFASSGSHDNRIDKIWWNEQWMGWPVGPHYEASSNVANAHRLKGKLFLAVGELDTNVDPGSTLQVVDALIRARKDFELLVVPNGGHGATGPDGVRRRNDFFVRHLLRVEPPDWNSGIKLEGEEDQPPSAAPGDGPSFGFFDHPDDGNPPWWWW